jgi:hypothetical protein
MTEALGYLGVFASPHRAQVACDSPQPWWRHGIEGMELIRNRVRKIIDGSQLQNSKASNQPKFNTEQTNEMGSQLQPI